MEQQQDIEQQEVEQQDVEQQEMEQQDVEQQEMEQQEVEQQEVEQQEVEQQEIDQQEVAVQQQEGIATQEELPKEELVQREIVEQQQIPQYNEQNNIDYLRGAVNIQNNNYNYNEIIENAPRSQTNYVNEPIQTPIQNVDTTNNIQQINNAFINTTTTTNIQEPLVFKDADEVNKYFESIGTNAYNQVVSSISTQNNLSSEINNLNTNTNTNNEEDLNKYFQPNAYIQNTNIDLASLGLGTGTSVQGANTEEEINKYFQSSGNSYNTGNADLLNQYGLNNQNNENLGFSEYKATTSKQSLSYNY